MFGKKENKQKGDFGEAAAAVYLKKKGYKILETNYRLKSGEIDIIASKREYIVFVEVKLRRNSDKGEPCEAVDYRKQQKIINTAKSYIQAKELYSSDFRFDVVEVITENNIIRHIENAFGEQ